MEFADNLIVFEYEPGELGKHDGMSIAKNISEGLRSGQKTIVKPRGVSISVYDLDTGKKVLEIP